MTGRGALKLLDSLGGGQALAGDGTGGSVCATGTFRTSRQQLHVSSGMSPALLCGIAQGCVTTGEQVMSDTTRIRAEDQGDGQPENAQAIQDESGGSSIAAEGEKPSQKGAGPSSGRNADDERSDGADGSRR